MSAIDDLRRREADIVIIRLVRSAKETWPTFSRDPNGQAIGRAPEKLVIVGDSGTLTRRPFGKRPWT